MHAFSVRACRRAALLRRHRFYCVRSNQARRPAGAHQAPAAPAKFVAPVKGTATIEVMRGQSKKAGKELITPLKIKNTSTGSISLLKIDELWYDKKRVMVTAGDYRSGSPSCPARSSTSKSDRRWSVCRTSAS